MADFSRWIQRRKLLAADVDEQIVVKYLSRHRRCGRGDPRTLGDLLEVLRQEAVVPRPRREAMKRSCGSNGSLDLTVERGLSQASLRNSLPFVRSFLEHRFRASAIVMGEGAVPPLKETGV